MKSKITDFFNLARSEKIDYKKCKVIIQVQHLSTSFLFSRYYYRDLRHEDKGQCLIKHYHLL